MATRSFLVLMMALLVFLISTFTVSLMQTNEIALIENQEGKKLYISEDLYDLNGNKIAVESLLEGKVLLNVWASWCITCLVEHPFLKKVTESKDVNLVGINYKDQDFNAKKYLIDNGDPYSFSIYDLSGNFSFNCKNLVLICIFIAIVKISISAMKFEDITVTFQPNKPKIPIIMITEKKQLLIGTTIHINFLKTNHKVAIINKKTPIPKTTISLLIKVIISSAIIGIPPKCIFPMSS